MSKRSSGEEWSDDDTDGYSLSDSPPKRQKSCQQFERKESSESGFLKRTIKRFTSSFSSLLKGFSHNSEERHISCDSVSNQSSVGMSQTDNSYSLNVSTGQQLIQSPIILTQVNSSHSSNYMSVQQSTHDSNQYITYYYIPNSIQISNTSPNNLMVVSNTSSTMLSNGVTKCTHCGQISSSPKSSCGHCKMRPTVPKDNKLNISSHTIPTQMFYTSPGIQGIGRGRHRSESPKIQLHENRDLMRPRISDVRSLNVNNNRNVFKPLHQLNPNSNKRPNHELIELDAESTQSSTNQLTSQETNDECIEIIDSNNREVIPAVGVQCDLNNDIKSDIKSKSVEQNTDNCKKEVEIIVEELDTIGYPDYAMFGTYKSEPKTVDFTKDGIKLTNVSPNSKDTKFKYHIMIPFIEMDELFYCTNETINLLFIKPTYISNLKIQESMYLGKESTNGLKFDVKSSDNRENYLIIVLREKMSEKFLKTITQCSKSVNSSLKVQPIEIEFGKHLLQISKCPKIASTVEQKVQIINNSSLKTPPNCNQRNPFQTPNSNVKNRLFQSSDSSESSPSPSKYSQKSKRSIIRSPSVPQIETIIVDDDDEDGEEIITANNHLETEFDRVIFSYPEDDKNAIHLIGTDIKCLNRGEFLNDNIVNFFLSYFFNEKLDEEMRRRTHIFDTLFFMQLTEKRPTKRKSSIDREESYSFETRYNQKLMKWTKGVNLFTKDFLIFPIIKESHWFLSIVCYPAAVYFLQSKSDKDLKVIDLANDDITPKIDHFEKRPCIIFMDSLGNASYKKSLSTPIRDFLNLEWKAQYKCEVMFKTVKYIRDYAPHVPNQTNSSDCGLFVLEYVEQFLKCPDKLVKKLIDNRKNALLDWFENDSVKTKRQDIRSLILSKVSPEVRDRLETLIDDSKLSDNEDFDEIGMELGMNKSQQKSSSKDSSPEQEDL